MNPTIGEVVLYRRPDGMEFNALVLADQGPGFVDVAYVETAGTPPFITSATNVSVVVAGPNGFAVA